MCVFGNLGVGEMDLMAAAGRALVLHRQLPCQSLRTATGPAQWPVPGSFSVPAFRSPNVRCSRAADSDGPASRLVSLNRIVLRDRPITSLPRRVSPAPINGTPLRPRCDASALFSRHPSVASLAGSVSAKAVTASSG